MVPPRLLYAGRPGLGIRRTTGSKVALGVHTLATDRRSPSEAQAERRSLVIDGGPDSTVTLCLIS